MSINLYSNKHAPGKDVSQKYMRTEIIRHIVTGGSLSEDGNVRASDAVVEEAARYKSFRSLLGTEISSKSVGKTSFLDYVDINGKKKVKVAKPKFDHVQLGVPNQFMKTCSRLETCNGPLFRDGGLYYIFDGDVPKMGFLDEVYKTTWCYLCCS